MDEKKLEELKQNPEFVKAVEAAETDAELVEVLKNFGIEATEEKLAEAAKYINEDGELNEEALEMVSGGIWTEICILAFMIGLARGLRCNKKGK